MTSLNSETATTDSGKDPKSEAMRILVIEDDEATAAYMVKGLAENGYVVDRVASGRDGLFHATSGQFDLIIVDRMLPEIDGLDVVKALRVAKVVTPVLFLSALGQVDDRVSGLRAGADDYLTKPFAFSELLARIEALLRRRSAGQVVTRTMLLEGVWDYHFDPQTNVIDVHISRLRQKIDKGFQPPLLHTVRGAGYCIRADN
jgi:two-component system OmpR family response regulator